MNLSRTLHAALLASVLVPLAANATERASSPEACPPGTTASSAYYEWRDGGFVRDGWVCAPRSTRSLG